MSTEPSDGEAREAEATGETVGEAKWAAVRELERRLPGLDKSAVEFVVLSEGERGLLGVGFIPARVIARAPAPAERPIADRPVATAVDSGLTSPVSNQLRDFLERVRDALGVEASISVHEEDGVSVGTFHGRDIGLVIGKRGQTIDAIQYLANAVLSRGEPEWVRAVVDAAGYRARRKTALENLADRVAAQVAATGKPSSLEPMTPSERKIVHVHLGDRPDVTTSSEGTEPARYVVVQPAE